MTESTRRAFLQTAAGAVAMAPLAGSAAAPQGSTRWKKAFMLGGLTRGPVLPTFQLLKEAGFDGVELISPNQLDQEEVLKAKAETGLQIHGVSGGVHWAKPLSDPDPAVVEAGLEAIRKEFADCKAYGGNSVLLVPAIVTPKVSHKQAYERSQAAIRKIIPLAEEHNIYLAIEEVWNKFLLSAPEFARYIDEFNSPWVKAYFDVGNVVEFGYPQEWIRELGKRIVKIHIKEYNKKERFSPKLGDGKEIDWSAIRQALVDIDYKGWITAEVGFGDLAAMKDVVARMDTVLGPF